jgi:predicted small lipoprotein YifL
MRHDVRLFALAALLLLSAGGQTGPLSLPEPASPDTNDETTADEDDD